jgi:hypothetical protein
MVSQWHPLFSGDRDSLVPPLVSLRSGDMSVANECSLNGTPYSLVSEAR